MYWPDYEEYVRSLGDVAASTPSSANTVFPPSQGQAHAPPFRIQPDDATPVSYTELQEALWSVREQKIVYIGSSFELRASLPRSVQTAMSKSTACEFFIMSPVFPET